MVKCEFIDRKGFKLLKVLPEAPYYYSFAVLPPFDTENWFGNGRDGDAVLMVDHLLFHLKSQIGDMARYEEMM